MGFEEFLPDEGEEIEEDKLKEMINNI